MLCLRRGYSACVRDNQPLQQVALPRATKRQHTKRTQQRSRLRTAHPDPAPPRVPQPPAAGRRPVTCRAHKQRAAAAARHGAQDRRPRRRRRRGVRQDVAHLGGVPRAVQRGAAGGAADRPVPRGAFQLPGGGAASGVAGAWLVLLLEYPARCQRSRPVASAADHQTGTCYGPQHHSSRCPVKPPLAPVKLPLRPSPHQVSELLVVDTSSREGGARQLEASLPPSPLPCWTNPHLTSLRPPPPAPRQVSELLVVDTSSREEDARQLEASLRAAAAVVVCVDPRRKGALGRLRRKWLPEAARLAPGAPVVVAVCKDDGAGGRADLGELREVSGLNDLDPRSDQITIIALAGVLQQGEWGEIWWVWALGMQDARLALDHRPPAVPSPPPPTPHRSPSSGHGVPHRCIPQPGGVDSLQRQGDAERRGACRAMGLVSF